MNSQFSSRLDYYINPGDLQTDEVDYELKLRCLPIDGTLQVRCQRLRQAQLEEVRRPKTLRVKKSIQEEYGTVKAKVQDIKHALQFYPEPKLISRLRHCRLRIQRSNAVTRDQVRIRNEFLSEIESLLDHYGDPMDRIGTQLPPNIHRNHSRVSEQEHGEEAGLLDEAIGGESSHASEGLQEGLDRLLEDVRNHSHRQGQDSLLPNRGNPYIPPNSNNLPTIPMENFKEEINQYIQQAITQQMATLIEKLTPMLTNRMTSTPTTTGSPVTPQARPAAPPSQPTPWSQLPPMQPPPPPSPPTPPPPPPPTPLPSAPVPQQPSRVRQQNPRYDRYPNSLASHVSLAGDFDPVPFIRPPFDPRNRWQVPVSKWRINFSGDSRGPTVTQFLNRVEVLARNNRVSDDELLSQANFFFKEGSEAEEWYFTFCNKFISWAGFKHQLRLRFEQPNKDRVIERQIIDRRQQPHETFNAFASAIEKLAQQLTRPMSEERKLDILTDNMRDGYKPFLTIYRIDRVEELITICHGLDKSMYRSYSNFPKNRPPQINHLEESEQEFESEHGQHEEELNAIGQTMKRKKTMESGSTGETPRIPQDGQNNILCWNCRQYGHYWRDCDKQKKIFCHFCGQMNYITSNCPNNHRFQSQQENEKSERS